MFVIEPLYCLLFYHVVPAMSKLISRSSSIFTYVFTMMLNVSVRCIIFAHTITELLPCVPSVAEL